MKTYIYLPNSRRSESSAEMKNYLFWYDHGIVNIANKFKKSQRRMQGCCNIQDGALCLIITKRSILDVAAALDPQVLAFF